MGIGYVA